MEVFTTKTLYSIADKEDQFDEWDITRYLRIYAREMEL